MMETWHEQSGGYRGTGNPATRTTPEFEQRIIGVHGEAGWRWLRSLPAKVRTYAVRWGLVVGPPFEPLSYNYVAPAVRNDGSEAVLKLGVPNPLLARETAALEYYDGRGAVRLLQVDVGDGALLLERLQPGTPLAELADDDQATIDAAATMQQLWRPLPAEHPFLPAATWARSLGRLRVRFDGGTGPLPADLVDRAEGLFAELLQGTGAPVLLHGDLHHFNIVAAEREPWLALDPHGAAGEPACETGALLRNRFEHLPTAGERRRLQARRVAILAERLGLDRQRVLAWGMAQAVLSAWWDVEDSTPGWQTAIACAEDLAALMQRSSARPRTGGGGMGRSNHE
jgi:streptomycin 6-kinase